jgi:hypothetical protein
VCGPLIEGKKEVEVRPCPSDSILYPIIPSSKFLVTPSDVPIRTFQRQKTLTPSITDVTVCMCVCKCELDSISFMKTGYFLRLKSCYISETFTYMCLNKVAIFPVLRSICYCAMYNKFSVAQYHS